MTWILVLVPMGPLAASFIGGYLTINDCERAGEWALRYRARQIVGYSKPGIWREFVCIPGPRAPNSVIKPEGQ